MYLPKNTKTKNTKKASKVFPKLKTPTKNRELVETNNISVFSTRRLQAKHRSKTVTNKVVVTNTVDTPPTPLKSIDEALEVKETIVEETVEETLVEETEEQSEAEALDLTALTKKQLIEVAKEQKVSYKNLNKTELIEALTIVLG